MAVTDCNTAEGLNVFFVCDGSTVSVTPITRTYVSADGTVVDGGQEEEEVVIDTIPQTTPSNTTNTNTTPVKTPEISTESGGLSLLSDAPFERSDFWLVWKAGNPSYHRRRFYGKGAPKHLQGYCTDAGETLSRQG